MNKNVTYFILGIMLIMMATFTYGSISSQSQTTDMQVILGIGGFLSVIVGILRLN